MGTHLQHHDDISIHDGTQAVRNNDGCPVVAKGSHGLLNTPLCQAVQRGGGFVQQQYEGVAQQGPSKGHPLLLPPTEAQAPLPYQSFIVLGETLGDGLVDGGSLSSLVYIVVVCCWLAIPASTMDVRMAVVFAGTSKLTVLLFAVCAFFGSCQP